MKPLIQNFARTQIIIYRTTEFSWVPPARPVSLCFLSTLPTSSTPLRLEGVGVNKCLSLPKGTVAGWAWTPPTGTSASSPLFDIRAEQQHRHDAHHAWSPTGKEATDAALPA